MSSSYNETKPKVKNVFPLKLLKKGMQVGFIQDKDLTLTEFLPRMEIKTLG